MFIHLVAQLCADAAPGRVTIDELFERDPLNPSMTRRMAGFETT
jgi:hypothetical protein